MADTIREQIVLASVLAFNTGTPAGVPQATRLLSRPYEVEEWPAIDVAPAREEAERHGGLGGRSRRRFTLEVRCFAAGPAVDKLLDPLVAWVTKALAGNTLGNLALDVEELGTEWEFELAEKLLGLAVVQFEISYQTKVKDQEAQT